VVGNKDAMRHNLCRLQAAGCRLQAAGCRQLVALWAGAVAPNRPTSPPATPGSGACGAQTGCGCTGRSKRRGAHALHARAAAWLQCTKVERRAMGDGGRQQCRAASGQQGVEAGTAGTITNNPCAALPHKQPPPTCTRHKIGCTPPRWHIELLFDCYALPLLLSACTCLVPPTPVCCTLHWPCTLTHPSAAPLRLPDAADTQSSTSSDMPRDASYRRSFSLPAGSTCGIAVREEHL